MKKIAVLTSGGDAPGMNAAIRGIVRIGIEKGWSILGVREGFAGLISGELFSLGSRDVAGMIQKGGTFLGSKRCEEFKTNQGQLQAFKTLQDYNIETLVVIGGNGSQSGSYKLHQMGFPVIGIASTIDNDLYGSEISIGVDTALNIAIEAIDRLKVTAASHHRAFLVEVMGRDSGYLALMTGIAGGAEVVVIPEVEINPQAIVAELRSAYKKGKSHALVVVSEGATYNTQKLSHYFQEHQQELGFEFRITILGHVQRGGAPTLFDRLLATRLAVKAMHCIEQEKYGLLIGLCEGKIGTTPLEEVVHHQKVLDPELIYLTKALVG